MGLSPSGEHRDQKSACSPENLPLGYKFRTITEILVIVYFIRQLSQENSNMHPGGSLAVILASLVAMYWDSLKQCPLE